MTLRPGIKRICWYTSRPLYSSLLVATGEKLQVMQELRQADAQRLMSARTEGSEHLDTFLLNPILHNADTIFTCVQLRLLVVLRAAAGLTQTSCQQCRGSHRNLKFKMTRRPFSSPKIRPKWPPPLYCGQVTPV